MAPPDENLVAFIATVVSFAIVLPLLIKWWPKAIPRPGARKPKRRAIAEAAPAAPAPRARESAPARPIAARAAPRPAKTTGAAPLRRPTAASARPRRPS